MNRVILVGLAAAAGLFLVGAFVVWIAGGRLDQDRLYCVNHLRQLGQFAGADVRDPRAPVRDQKPPRDAVPAGTVVNPLLPPDLRLSWAAAALLVLDQRTQPTAELSEKIDRSAAWDAGPNAAVGGTRVGGFVCPANPTAGANTQYLGMAGLNPDAAGLDLGPPVQPRAGCFRYDAPTPFAAIADGLSQTILFAETNRDLGPWLRGGPSTVRGLDIADGSAVPIGVGGQFGGNHFGGANLGFADGSVRFLTDKMSPDVFRKLVTIVDGSEREGDW
ncbi:MAG: DUF1559 domain-containing protein [Fimbriiglobus sp.]